MIIVTPIAKLTAPRRWLVTVQWYNRLDDFMRPMEPDTQRIDDETFKWMLEGTQ